MPKKNNLLRKFHKSLARNNWETKNNFFIAQEDSEFPVTGEINCLSFFTAAVISQSYRIGRNNENLWQKLLLLSLIVQVVASSQGSNQKIPTSTILKNQQENTPQNEFFHESNTIFRHQTGTDKEFLTAIQENDFKMAEENFNKGANVNAVDNQGRSAVEIAVTNLNYEITEFLLRKGGDTEISFTTKEDVYESVPALVKIATNPDMNEFLELFLEYGAEPNIRSSGTYTTPLMTATLANNKKGIYILMRYGADLYLTNKNGQSPLVIAQRSNYREIVTFFIHYYEIKKAVSDSSFKDIDITTNELQELFFVFVCNDAYLKETEYLLKDRITVNQTDDSNSTGLHFAAVFKKAIGTIELLLQYGSNVNSLNSFNNTPLMKAARYGNVEAIFILLAHGAEVSIRNNISKTAIDLTYQYSHNYIGDILTSYYSLSICKTQKNYSEAFKILNQLDQNARNNVAFKVYDIYFTAMLQGDFQREINKLTQLTAEYPHNKFIKNILEDLKKQTQETQNVIPLQKSIENDSQWMLGNLFLVITSLIVLTTAFFSQRKVSKKLLQEDDINNIFESFKFEVGKTEHSFAVAIRSGSFDYMDANNKITVNYTIKQLKQAIKKTFEKFQLPIEDNINNLSIFYFRKDFSALIPQTKNINLSIKLLLYDKYKQIKTLKNNLQTHILFFANIRNSKATITVGIKKLTEELEMYPENINNIIRSEQSKVLYKKYDELRNAIVNKKMIFESDLQTLDKLSDNTLESELEVFNNALENNPENSKEIELQVNELLNNETTIQRFKDINEKIRDIENETNYYHNSIDIKIAEYKKAKNQFDERFRPEYKTKQRNFKPLLPSEKNTENNRLSESFTPEIPVSMPSPHQGTDQHSTTKAVRQNDNNNNNNNNNDIRNPLSAIVYKKNTYPKSKSNLIEEDTLKLQFIRACCEKLGEKATHLFYNSGKIFELKRDIWEIIFNVIQAAETLLKCSAKLKKFTPSEQIEAYRNTVRHATKYFEEPNSFLINSFKGTVKIFSTEVVRIISALEESQKITPTNNIANANQDLRIALSEIKSTSREENNEENNDFIIIKRKLLDLYEMRNNFRVLNTANEPVFIDAMKYSLALLGDAIKQLRNKHREKWQIFKAHNTTNLFKNDIYISPDNYERLGYLNKTSKTPLLTLLLNTLFEKPTEQKKLLDDLSPFETLGLFIEFYQVVGHCDDNFLGKINTGFLLILLDCMQTKLLPAVEYFDSFIVEPCSTPTFGGRRV